MKKSKRYKIYKKALKDLNESHRWPYLCNHIRRNWNSYASDAEIKEEFPEFAGFKPKKITTGTAAWWNNDEEGFEIRINVLKKCIQLTKPKSNGVSRGRGVSKRISISPRKKTNRRGATVVRRARKKSKAR